MEFNQQDDQKNSIISVTDSIVTLSHTTLKTPCFISTNHCLETPDLTMENLDKMALFPLSCKDDIDILLIGTGATGKFLNPQQQVEIQQMGIGFESMSSESACRSFNLLLADVRLVGLLLL
ncbi:Membrane protein [uncultured Candidatus Thioglobus sp.]|nr:Membrane protein [uncultured Candidatus Thioglobus sp.]